MKHWISQSYIRIHTIIMALNGGLRYTPKVMDKLDKIIYQFFWKCQKAMLMETNMNIKFN